MKPHLFFAILPLAALWSLSSSAAESSGSASTPVVAAEPTAKTLTGEYAGKWQSSGDVSGNLRLKLKQDGAAWTAEASFTVEDAALTPKVKGVKVDGNKIELVFGWEFRGTPQETTLTGEAASDTLSGRYESKTAGEASTGTWTVKRA